MSRTFPGQEEDDPAVTGGRVQHAHGAGAVVAGQDDVDAGTWLHDTGLLWVVHVTYHVCKRTWGGGRRRRREEEEEEEEGEEGEGEEKNL